MFLAPLMGDRICRSSGAPDSLGRVVLQLCRRYAAGSLALGFGTKPVGFNYGTSLERRLKSTLLRDDQWW